MELVEECDFEICIADTKLFSIFHQRVFDYVFLFALHSVHTNYHIFTGLLGGKCSSEI